MVGNDMMDRSQTVVGSRNFHEFTHKSGITDQPLSKLNTNPT